MTPWSMLKKRKRPARPILMSTQMQWCRCTQQRTMGGRKIWTSPPCPLHPQARPTLYTRPLRWPRKIMRSSILRRCIVDRTTTSCATMLINRLTCPQKCYMLVQALSLMTQEGSCLLWMTWMKARTLSFYSNPHLQATRWRTWLTLTKNSQSPAWFSEETSSTCNQQPHNSTKRNTSRSARRQECISALKTAYPNIWKWSNKILIISETILKGKWCLAPKLLIMLLSRSTLWIRQWPGPLMKTSLFAHQIWIHTIRRRRGKWDHCKREKMIRMQSSRLRQWSRDESWWKNCSH